MKGAILDVAFYTENSGKNSAELLLKHSGSWEHYPLMAQSERVYVLKFCKFNHNEEQGNLKLLFRKANGPVARLFHLRKILRQIQPDVIVTHSFLFPIQTLFLITMLRSGTKVLVQLHADVPDRFFLIRVLKAYCYKWCNAFIFTSVRQSSPFKDIGYIKTQPVFEIMEGSTNRVGAARLKRTSDKPIILWVGRLIERKDPFTLLRCCNELHKKGIDFELRMIYNDATLIKEVTDYIEKHDLVSKIVLLGELPSATMHSQYIAADYFVSTSHHEGSGWSLCEAMASGCVPIVSGIPSHEKMLGSSGYLFEPGNSAALQQIIESLFSEDYAAKSKQVFEHFKAALSFEAIARDTLLAVNSLRRVG